MNKVLNTFVTHWALQKITVIQLRMKLGAFRYFGIPYKLKLKFWQGLIRQSHFNIEEGSNPMWVCSVVHASTNPREREQLWSDLSNFNSGLSLP